MILKGTCYPLILKFHDTMGSILEIEKTSKTEETYSEQLLDHPHIIEIAPTSQNNGNDKRWLYTNIGKITILTTHLGQDYNGKISLANLLRENRERLSKLEIEHVSTLERLKERHLERILNKRPSWKKELVEEAYHEYSSLVFAYLDKLEKIKK